jgi:phage shock protein A
MNEARKSLARQLLLQKEPEQVLAELLGRIEQLENQLANAGPAMEQSGKMSIGWETAIKVSTMQLHQIFHQLQVPNAIHSKVIFPDGLYEIRFIRLKTPNFN